MKRILFTTIIGFAATIAFAQKGLEVGDKAPLFTAKDQSGRQVILSEELKQGSVVLVFYRGYWCPYCNLHLKKLEDSLSLIKAKGARLITITPEQEASVSKTVEKTKASYTIISDKGLDIMKKYDVAFAVEEKTVEKYRDYGIDFNKVNGQENSSNLPVPAVYIIDAKGLIKYRFFDKNYTRRATVADILTHL